MNIIDLLKKNSTVAVFGANIVIALYILGDGKILSYQGADWIVYLAIAITLFTYNMLHKDILHLQTENEEIRQKQVLQEKPKEKKEEDEDPFGLNEYDKYKRSI